MLMSRGAPALIGANRQTVSIEAIGRPMIITAAACSLNIVFIHLLFHGSKNDVYLHEEDEVRKNSSQYMNKSVFSTIENRFLPKRKFKNHL